MFDIVSCSLVLNFVATAEDRGELVCVCVCVFLNIEVLHHIVQADVFLYILFYRSNASSNPLPSPTIPFIISLPRTSPPMRNQLPLPDRTALSRSDARNRVRDGEEEMEARWESWVLVV